MNTQTFGNLGENFVTNLLNVPNKFDQAYASWEAEGYSLFNQMAFQMNIPTGGSRKTDEIKFEVPTIGGVEVYATVTAAPTLSGANLVVTVPASNNKFRVSELVADNNKIQGRVVARTNTTITLSPVSVAAWNTATHFQSGNIAHVIGQASVSKFSTGLDSLYNIPEYGYNFTQIQRESVGMARRDKLQTYTVYKGSPFWSNAQVDQTVQRFLRKKELTFYWGERTLTGATDENDPNAVTTTGGIRWNVINNGGMYQSMTSEINFNSWIDYLSEFKRRNPTTSKVVGVCGQDFMRGIQTGVTNTYITQAGNRNTFGGMSVKGIDVREFSYNGLTVELALWTGFDAPENQAILSSITGRPRWSHSCLLMPTTPIMSASGGPALPALVPYHFGDRQYMGGFRKGLIDFGTDTMSRGDLGAAMADLTLNGMVTDLDAFNFELYCDWGLWVQAERMMLLELAS